MNTCIMHCNVLAKAILLQFSFLVAVLIADRFLASTIGSFEAILIKNCSIILNGLPRLKETFCYINLNISIKIGRRRSDDCFLLSPSFSGSSKGQKSGQNGALIQGRLRRRRNNDNHVGIPAFHSSGKKTGVPLRQKTPFRFKFVVSVSQSLYGSFCSLALLVVKQLHW